MLSPKILLAEDEKLLCELLAKQLKESFPSCTITHVAALRDLEQVQGEFDLAVVDVGLAGGSSLPWVHRWTAAQPGRKVLIVTARDQDYILHSIASSPAAGVFHKTDGIEAFELAIRAVMAGATFFSPQFRQLRARSGADPQHFAKLLSPREQEVLMLVAEGSSAADIACELGISEQTVADHRKNVMRKLELHTRAELMSYALKKGFVQHLPSFQR